MEVDRTALYRHFDASSALLYVGISKNPFNRLDAHSRTSDWMELSVTMQVVWFDSRQDALDAEASAIRDENPIYNVQHPSVAIMPTPIASSVVAEFLTVEECAARLQIDPELLYDEIEAETLKSVAIGAEIRVSAKAFASFIKLKEAPRTDVDSETTAEFVQYACVDRKGALVLILELHTHYLQWMDKSSDQVPFAIGEFSKRLNTLGYRSIRIRGKRYKQNIEVKKV